MSDRASNLHQARVYLREAKSRSRNPAQRDFCFTLLAWAGNCRRRAMAIKPAQGDLFGGAA